MYGIKPYLIVILLFFGGRLLSQDLSQTIRGTILDQESQFPLIGVNIQVTTDTTWLIGTVSEVDGSFRLERVPVGRHQLLVTYLGYEPVVLDNIIVTSGKEVILNIEMMETLIEVAEVKVVARKSGEVANEMALVSARAFSVEETDRYAGSRGDPGRMASNFAGVQGADDSRNDIVIRGNSPQGVLWKVEGIAIPNPSHFSIPGTSGGPASILNNKYLANSDFFTGAFPAEFGNSIAGAFDLRMRNGNNEKHEFSGQLGFLGTELFAEGPISKSSKSSYLASYRYSTLQLFSGLGINIGTDATPKYQDGAFRVNFPFRGGGQLALWGIAGKSDIDIVLSEQEKPDTETFLYGENDRDQYFHSKMGVFGLTYTKPFNKSTFLKTSVAYSKQVIGAEHNVFVRHIDSDGYFVLDSLNDHLRYQFDVGKLSIHSFLNKKVSQKSTIKIGVNLDFHQFVFIDSIRAYQNDSMGIHFADWRKRWDMSDSPLLAQPFIQYKYKFNNKWTASVGLTALYYGINDNSFSPLEPRLGLSYQIKNNQSVSLGLGMHSQNHSPYLYYYGDRAIQNDPIEENLGMGLMKSSHAVLGYDYRLKKNMRFKLETYYQVLSEIPVKENNSSFSMVNAGAGFSRLFPDTVLVNEGVGRNYGLEVTVERFFSGGFYFLMTGSVFDAKYKASDDVWRNTTFNGRYAFNGLLAQEFTINKQSTLNLGGKLTYAGGRWYGEVDEAKSIENQEVIFEDSGMNTKQFKDYFRADAKVNYRWNRPKVTHEFSIDFVNVFNIKNILKLSYAPDHPSGNPIQEEYQLGFLPIFYYKVDF